MSRQRSLNRTYIERKIARNLTNRPIILGDLKQTVIPARSQQDLLQWNDEKDIAQSHDLKAAIQAGLIRMVVESASTRPAAEKQLVKPTIEQAEGLTTQGSGTSENTPTQPEETEYVLTTTTGTIPVDWANGKSQVVTVTGDFTFSFSNPVNGTYVIRIVQDGSGGHDFSGWPTDWLTEGGAAGRLSPSSGAGDVSLYVLYYSENTTKYYVSTLLDFS